MEPEMDPERTVVRSKIAADLRSLGLKEGDLLMSHESVKAIGWIVGGPQIVIQAILDVIGPSGTLVKYIGAEGSTYEMASWPPEIQKAYRDEFPAFDPQRTRAYRYWGILTEYLRTWPGACRSSHPESSFAAVGRLASWITEKHPYSYGFGPESPMARFVEAQGKVLSMGCPFAHTTSIHHAEHMAHVPNKKIIRYQAPVLQEGRRAWIDIEEFNTSSGIVDWPYEEDYFETIVKAYLQSGAGRQGMVGHAKSFLVEASGLHDFAMAWMESEFSAMP